MTSSKMSYVAAVLLNRFTIIAFNAIIMIIMISSVWELLSLLGNHVDDFDRMEDILEGIATVLISYGVVLEERDSLLEMSDCHAMLQDKKEQQINYFCHNYGIILLVFGLLAEVASELVKIPDNIFNTAGIEGIMFGIGAVILLLSGVAIARFCWRLLRVAG